MPTRARNFIVYLGGTFSRRVNLVPGPDSDLDGWTGEFIVFADDDNREERVLPGRVCVQA